ncbi:MAG TPA: transcriptional regulator [Nitriliruptorales bacterium]
MELPELDPIIHQPTRLRIMALLHRNRDAAFTWVRDTLKLTDGNLNSHATRLERAGYVQQGRTLTPAGFQVRLRLTRAGDDAFRAYVAALRSYLVAELDAALAVQP